MHPVAAAQGAARRSAILCCALCWRDEATTPGTAASRGSARRRAHLFQRVDDERLAALGRAAHVVDLEALGDDLTDGEPRAQAAEGILKYHLHLAAQRTQIPRASALNVPRIELDDTFARLQAQQRRQREEFLGSLDEMQQDAVDGRVGNQAEWAARA